MRCMLTVIRRVVVVAANVVVLATAETIATV